MPFVEKKFNYLTHIYINKINNLDDKFILIRENNRGDIYDEICRITDKNYQFY